MRSIRLLVTILVVSVLLAGCADLRERIEAPPAPEYSAVLPWGLTDCDFAIAIIPIDPEGIASRVPEGFRVLSTNEIGVLPTPTEGGPLTTPNDPRGDGNIGIEVFTCASGTGMNTTDNITPLAYGSVFSFVEPPEALREENRTFHFLKWDVLIPDQGRQRVLVDEGVPASNGSATFSRFQDVGPGKNVGALLQLGDHEYAFSGGGQPQGLEELTDVSFVEFTPVRGDEFVEWRTNFTATTLFGGSGTVELEDGSWVEEAVGSTRTQAWYLAGTGSFTNGSISLPYRE